MYSNHNQINGFFNRGPKKKTLEYEYHEPLLASLVDKTIPVSFEDVNEAIFRYQEVFGRTPSKPVLDEGFRHCASRIHSFVLVTDGAKHSVWSPIKKDKGKGMCIWSLGIGRILKPHKEFSEWQSRTDLKRNLRKKKKIADMDESKTGDVVNESGNPNTLIFNSDIAYDASPVINPEAMEKIFPHIVRKTQEPITTITSLVTCLSPLRNTSPEWPSLYGTSNLMTGVDNGIGNGFVVNDKGEPTNTKIWTLRQRGMRDFAKQPNYNVVLYRTEIPGFDGKLKTKTVNVVCGYPISPLFTKETIEYAKRMMKIEVTLCFTGAPTIKNLDGTKIVLPSKYTLWFIVNVLHSASYDMFKMLKHLGENIEVEEYVDRSLTIFNYEMATSLACINGDPELQKEFSKYASAFLQTPSSVHCNPSNDLRLPKMTMNVLTCLLIGHPRKMLTRPIMQALVAKMVQQIPYHRSADQQKIWFGADGKGGIRAKWEALGDEALNDYDAIWGALDVDDKDEMLVATRHLLDIVKEDLMITICMLEYFAGRNPETMYYTLSSNFNQLPRSEMKALIAKMNVYRKRFDKKIKSKEDMGRMTIFIREALGWNAADPRSSESAILNWMDFIKLFAYMVVKLEPLRVQKPVFDETTQIRFSIDGTVYLGARCEEKVEIKQVAVLKPEVRALTQRLDQLRRSKVDVDMTINVRLGKEEKTLTLIETKKKLLNFHTSSAYIHAEEEYQARIHNTGSPMLRVGSTDIPLKNTGAVSCLFCNKQFGSTQEVIAHIKAKLQTHRKIFSGKIDEPTISFSDYHHLNTCRNKGGWRCPACNLRFKNPRNHLWFGDSNSNECWGGQSSKNRRMVEEAKTTFYAQVAIITTIAHQRVREVDEKIALIRICLVEDMDLELKKIDDEKKELLIKIDLLDQGAADLRRSEAEIIKKREEERLIKLESKKKEYEEERSRLGAMVNLSFADQMLQSNCPICTYEFKQDNVRLYIPCGHIGCEVCTDKWTEHCNDADMDVTCPICRQIIQQTMPLPRL
jgi:hypothetical protein